VIASIDLTLTLATCRNFHSADACQVSLTPYREELDATLHSGRGPDRYILYLLCMFVFLHEKLPVGTRKEVSVKFVLRKAQACLKPGERSLIRRISLHGSQLHNGRQT